jgi:hypothetical protein
MQHSRMSKGMILTMNFTEFEINQGTRGRSQGVRSNASLKTSQLLYDISCAIKFADWIWYKAKRNYIYVLRS